MAHDGKSGSRLWMGVSLRTWSLVTFTIQFSTFILLLHHSRVMETPDGRRYLPSTAIFLVEVVKLALCSTVALYETSLSIPRSAPVTSLLSAFGSAVLVGDSWKMAVPASLYTLSNSLQYAAISNLDAATFHVIYQIKILVTALLSVSMLGRTISGRQWVSLVLLMIGVAIVSMPRDNIPHFSTNHHGHVYLPRSINQIPKHLGTLNGASRMRKRSATYEGIVEDEQELNTPGIDTSFGVMAVVLVCICSGFAGVYFEKVIKDSPKHTSLWIRNVQLSLYSLFPAFFIGVVFLDGENVAKYGFFAGYNWIVVLSIFIQSLGGILAAFCIFFSDNISKNFAVSISMVLSSFISFLFFDFTATQNFLFGASVVLGATFMYNMEERRILNEATQHPTITIEEYEKSSLDTPTEQKDISILIPKTPLTTEQPALSTSRPGSPKDRKRKAEPAGYFESAHG